MAFHRCRAHPRHLRANMRAISTPTRKTGLAYTGLLSLRVAPCPAPAKTWQEQGPGLTPTTAHAVVVRHPTGTGARLTTRVAGFPVTPPRFTPPTEASNSLMAPRSATRSRIGAAQAVPWSTYKDPGSRFNALSPKSTMRRTPCTSTGHRAVTKLAGPTWLALLGMWIMLR